MKSHIQDLKILQYCKTKQSNSLLYMVINTTNSSRPLLLSKKIK